MLQLHDVRQGRVSCDRGPLSADKKLNEKRSLEQLRDDTLSNIQPLQVRVYRQRELCHMTMLNGELQIGRQRPGEPEPFFVDSQASRLVIAALNDKSVSREHLLLRIVAENIGDIPEIETRNLSRKRSVVINGRTKLGPEQSARFSAPVLISFEDFAIRVEQPEASTWEVKRLEHATLAPGSRVSDIRKTQLSLLPNRTREDYSTEQLVNWLGQTMEVLQSAAGASDFLAQAVNAVDRIVGLDTIAALRYENGGWSIAASKDSLNSDLGSDTRSPSRTILQGVLDRKCTIFHLPSKSIAALSLQDVKALVAAPILNPSGEVIGALYGARYHRDSLQLPQISELEATLVEVIACSAAAGIAREFQQQKAIKARVQFEQFFTPQLARELESNPSLLDGHDAEVSILFCDVVGFSAISARIGPRQTMHWISDVMDCLSDAVLQHDGVVVDYIGDELLAMWGAPKVDKEDATKACMASADLLRCKQTLDQAWQSKIGSMIDFRIGISSGIASVGNTGSKRRLKYGPLGNTVNLASRLQSVSKHFGVRRLVSQSTAERADCRDLVFRPLGLTQLVNIPAPIMVYELLEDSPSTRQLASAFERILLSLEKEVPAQTQRELEELQSLFPTDAPTNLLLQRLRMGQSIVPACLWNFATK